MKNRPYLSVVICVYNEEDNVHPMTEQVEQTLQEIDYELIYVDDGSTDKTVERIVSHPSPRIKLVELKKNYGQSTALSAGIDAAEGEYIVTLDGDLQNDPSDIPMMLNLLHEKKVDVVAGIRAKRQDNAVVRLLPSKIANWIIRASTGVHIKDYGCTLKVFHAKIAKDMGLYGELHRFIPVLAVLEGAKIEQVDVKHHARLHGTSKYGLNRTIKVMSDLLLMIFLKKYLAKPMHLFGAAGIITFGAGILLNAYLLLLKLLGGDIWGKPLLVLAMMLVLGGIQLITIGIVVELLMRIYYEGQNKRTYRVKTVYVGGEAQPEST